MRDCSVSVVIPCHRCADTIERAVNSIVKQTSLPQEVIFVDDASNDNTLEILHALRERYRELISAIIRLPVNSGAGMARNAGWDIAKGDYVAFLDADDSWHSRKLEIQFQWMRQHPQAVFSGHAVVFKPQGADEASTPVVAGCKPFRAVGYRELLCSNKFLTPSVLIRRDAPVKFDRRQLCEDYLLWCRLVARGCRGYWSNCPLAYIHKFYYGAGGLSRDLKAMGKAEREVYRILRKEGSLSGIWLAALLALNAGKVARRRLRAY